MHKLGMFVKLTLNKDQMEIAPTFHIHLSLLAVFYLKEVVKSQQNRLAWR